MTRPRTRVVLSDLDDTLFDHAHATRAALDALHSSIAAFHAWSLDELDRRHRDELEVLHLDVLAGGRSIESARIERFRRLLAAAGADRPLEQAGDLARRYRHAYERSWQPVAGALEFLEQITRAGASVVIVTNNVVQEQRDKLARCGLAGLVTALVASAEIGVSKPDVAIFHEALRRAGAEPEDAVMVGDAWSTDIVGARAAGIRAVWLNRFGTPRPDASVHELRSLEPAEVATRVVLGE
ncbi:MAG TPA: HAD family hydrolase [Vicinamibacterales bacterium]|nr:HAD family hydrolase [Vicinamibacterales bacterium]